MSEKNHLTSQKFPDPFSTRNLVLFWIVFGTLAHVHEVWYLRGQGMYRDNAFVTVFIFCWFLWAALTPFMFRAVKQFPITEDNIKLSIVRIVLLISGFVALHMILDAVINLIFAALFFKSELVKLPDILPSRMQASLIRKLFIAGFIIAAAQAIHYFKRLKEKEVKEADLQRKLAEAQLDALKMQLQPHFLFNTHHSIIALMMKNDTDKAINMLVSLCDLLRLNLDASKENLITLDKELNACKLYLQIQQIRFSDRLDVDYKILGPLRNARIPAFILQPFIENSIKHGIEKYKEFGRIEIIARQEGSNLQIEVIDDGNAPNDQPIRKGVGISNAEARLAQLFGSDFKLELHRLQPRGTKLFLQLPLIH